MKSAGRATIFELRDMIGSSRDYILYNGCTKCCVLGARDE
jgi:hypothetical protein